MVQASSIQRLEQTNSLALLSEEYQCRHLSNNRSNRHGSDNPSLSKKRPINRPCANYIKNTAQLSDAITEEAVLKLTKQRKKQKRPPKNRVTALSV